MIKYIIFDVDRTLVDSFKPELLSFQEAINKVLNVKLTKDQINKFATMPTKLFFKSLGLNEEKQIKIMKEWEITFPKYKTTCFDGIKDVLKELNKKGYILGIITSRSLEEYHELDEEFKNISDLFKIIVTSDKIQYAKPNPESMNYLCNQLNCKNEEVLYIGDSYIDKEFAKNSNCSFIPACFENKELKNEENACFNPKDIFTYIEKH